MRTIAQFDAALAESTKNRIAERLAYARKTPEFIKGAKGTINLSDLDGELPEIVARLNDDPVDELLQSHIGRSYSRRLCYRSPQPGHGAQALHTDWKGNVPLGNWVVANVFIALCDIDASNGGTRLVPRSHREFSGFQAKSPADRHSREVVPRLSTGDALIFSGHILHSGTKNSSTRERPIVMANYQRY